jgi:hypothetical protein
MPVRKVEVERFSLTTSRPFESVVSALKAGIGQLDLAAFASASKSSGTFAELEEVINRNMGESGLCCSWNSITVPSFGRKQDSRNRRS